jgi:SAM-dependent methyltransferase
MPNSAIQLEEERLTNNPVDEKPLLRERHRAFPAIFENRGHHKILDVAAGMGYTVMPIQEKYNGKVFCNDLSPTCLKNLKAAGFPAMRFTLDQDMAGFPIESKTFDAVIATSTIEHILEVDGFVEEVNRILKEDGYFYVSAPNYMGLMYLLPALWSGKTFHDPLDPHTRYEFYGHVRYFTYRSLLEYVSQFGFVAEAVYLLTPRSSDIYQKMVQNSPLKAFLYRWGMTLLYKLSPRWASEPILCFKKTTQKQSTLRRVIL